MNATVRAATFDDLAALTAIRNHYIVNTHITFDTERYDPANCVPWFEEHCDGKRYRTFAACDGCGSVIGYAATGRFRAKPAYETTVEASIACLPQATGRGLGSLLYATLFDAIANEDIHRVVAGIAQPNPASMALHRRFGFAPVGTFTEVGRKFGRYWDVVWFERPMKL
jgi:phosphinothricin acetyltransferase